MAKGSKLHEPTPRYGNDKRYMTLFDLARDIHVGEAEPQFKPPSSVMNVNEIGSVVYTKCGICSESEISKISGFTPQQLKMTPASDILSRTESGHKQKLYVISLDGLEPSVTAGIRKMKIYSKIGVGHDEFALHYSNQIEQDQGARVFQACHEGMQNSSVLKSKPWQLKQLMEKATSIQKQRLEQETLLWS